MSHQPLPSCQIPTCETCKLQPMPESSQYLPFIILEIMLILYSIKLSLLVLLLGYVFSKTVWICPMCKREVKVKEGKIFPPQEHVIVRLNDCMVLMSKTKFRILAALLGVAIGYWFLNEPKYEYKPRTHIEKTWKSVVSNCGYETYMENSFKFRYFYDIYQDSNDWQIEGVYLGEEHKVRAGYNRLKIKMIPTQFKNPEAEDIHVLIHDPTIHLEKGQVVQFTGEWSGNDEHILIFLAKETKLTARKISNIQEQVQVLSMGLLRQHTPS